MYLPTEQYMEAITVYPKNKEQLNAVEAVLKVLKVPFKKK
jgi:hypothetical protein